ncbi:MAG: phosphate transporter substrate-binding protein [Anaerocolumna sp.]|nr:phosphate transporter substrate-binding protein [Anaerocolumna sp.]
MKKMFGKKIFGLLVALTMVFALTACGSKKDTGETTESDNSNTESTTAQGVSEAGDLAGTVTITGSTSVEKILLDMADEFMAYNPSREGASGTRGAFEELIGLDEVGLVESATVVEGNGNVQASVAGNENAIGYVSFSFIDETVKALTLEGVEANAENAKAGSYLLSRPFLLTYKPETLSDVTKAFLEYVVTSDAQVFVEDHGGIRVD